LRLAAVLVGMKRGAGGSVCETGRVAGPQRWGLFVFEIEPLQSTDYSPLRAGCAQCGSYARTLGRIDRGQGAGGAWALEIAHRIRARAGSKARIRPFFNAVKKCRTFRPR